MVSRNQFRNNQLGDHQLHVMQAHQTSNHMTDITMAPMQQAIPQVATPDDYEAALHHYESYLDDFDFCRKERTKHHAMDKYNIIMQSIKNESMDQYNFVDETEILEEMKGTNQFIGTNKSSIYYIGHSPISISSNSHDTINSPILDGDELARNYFKKILKRHKKHYQRTSFV